MKYEVKLWYISRTTHVIEANDQQEALEKSRNICDLETDIEYTEEHDYEISTLDIIHS